MKNLTDFIRTIPDFPHEGILFRDVTTLFGDPEGFRMAVDQMVELYRDAGVDKVAGLEARGFIIGGALADRLGLGFVPVRKAGKLPGSTISEDYTLEYGTATLEVHDDAIAAGEKVLLIDDLIATGGTAVAGIRLIERLGGQITRAGFIIDLPDLGGADVVRGLGVPVDVLCAFEGL
ncbi:MAG: adenine phosphoribosyltransferase [Pseudomonadota bacterium]